MHPYYSLTGMLELEITSANPEFTLDKIRHANITLHHVHQISDLTWSVLLKRKDCSTLQKLFVNQGISLKIRRKYGLYWYITEFLHRRILVFTLVCLVFLSIFLPSRILFVHVEGNQYLSDREILTAAESCGIRFGTNRKNIRSEKVKNALLASIPQLQWVGVNTTGCVAVITVQERKNLPLHPEKCTVSNIIADRDGYILTSTVTRGTRLCHPGDTVREGQILISGYTDCGISIQATRAEGEVFAQTNRNLTAIMPKIHDFRKAAYKTQYRFSLLLGKKRIFFWKDSRIPSMDCGRMYEEYYVTLPGGFRLPIALCVDRYLFYVTEESSTEAASARIQLQQFSEHYLIRQMIAGQITDTTWEFTEQDPFYRLSGEYICIEMIGKEQREQIGDINGKRN